MRLTSANTIFRVSQHASRLHNPLGGVSMCPTTVKSVFRFCQCVSRPRIPLSGCLNVSRGHEPRFSGVSVCLTASNFPFRVSQGTKAANSYFRVPQFVSCREPPFPSISMCPTQRWFYVYVLPHACNAV